MSRPPVLAQFSAVWLVLIFLLCGKTGRAQTTSADAVQAEVDRGERRIREVRVEIGNRYEKRLGDLRAAFQKTADLENALAVRSEEKRIAVEPETALDARNLVEEPRALRDLQSELLAKQTEMVAQIIQEIVPKLVDVKKALTVAGKLDEAVEVRNGIQKLQDAGAPAQRLSNGSQVTAEEVYMAYQSAKERADKMYKSVKVILRGRVVGVRPDARDSTSNVLVLYGGAEGALVDCAFQPGEYKVREERSGQTIFYVVAHVTGDVPALRLQRGAVAELQGRCEGAEGGVRFGNCGVPRR